MNVEIDARDIEQIAEKVAAKLLPILRAELVKKNDDEIMSVPELAELLRVEKSWIYRQTQLGAIPYTKPGKYVLFRRSEINCWLANKTVRPVRRDN